MKKKRIIILSSSILFTIIWSVFCTVRINNIMTEAPSVNSETEANSGDITDNSDNMVDKEGLIPGRYYIEEYNGYLAIYKCNDDYELVIEDEEDDVFMNVMEYSYFNDQDREYFESHKATFDNKEDARNYMTQFMS